MQALLKLSRAIDGLNSLVGRAVIWLILASTVISGINALVRKILHTSSNAYLEVQWYLFAAAFLLAAGYTLLQGEHVKVDVFSSRLPKRTQIWIEIFGFVFFLTPMVLTILWFSVPFVKQAMVTGEMSGNSGGLIRWPVYLMIPVGFTLLFLQGGSELIKRIAFLRGLIDDPTIKKSEKTAEEDLAEALRGLVKTKDGQKA
ncbi:TRAP transporter small permease subunit [Comamonas composti]|uniref:TRAP transporter small permease subunit n=1 Tax=Comamonas composti TaxID=408558 RepID=UPI000402AEEA|nr:TRAP transporter small permease subunit [Comamonas composti]